MTMIEDEATVFLHEFNGEVQKVVVNRADTVATLQKYLPDVQKNMLFYNGYPLFWGFTFKFYNISNGDHVYLTSSPPLGFNPNNAMLIQCLFEGFKNGPFQGDGPPFHNSSRDLVRKEKFLRETARLKDQFYSKIEGTVQYHRKFIAKFSNVVEKAKESKQLITSIIPPALQKPCCLALPSFWKAEPESEPQVQVEDNT